MDLKKYLTRQNIKFGLLLLAVFIVGFFTTYTILKYTKVFVKTPTPTSSPSADQNVKFAPAPAVTEEKGVYNTIFLGYGGAGHEGSYLTDSMIIVHVDTNKKTAALISIPRDLWVTGNHKINAEASMNGFQNEGGVLKNVTGLNVGYFVSVDFGGFIKLIDDLGGITVDNPKTFDDPYYPITGQENNGCGFSADQINALKAKYSGYNLEIQFTCRYEHLHFDQGSVNLDGTSALKFVRSRHGDSDFGRSIRQFAVLKGIAAKLVSLHAFDKTNKAIDNLTQIVRTNLVIGGIRSLIDVIGPVSGYKINEIHLTTDNVLNEGTASDGEYILYPKAGMFEFSGIKAYINSNIN